MRYVHTLYNLDEINAQLFQVALKLSRRFVDLYLISRFYLKIIPESHSQYVMTWSLYLGKSNPLFTKLPSLTATGSVRPTFPSTCLSPDQPGYGQVVASNPNRRRARRSAVQQQGSAAAQANAPRDPNANWSVVTPNAPNNTHTARSVSHSVSHLPPPAGYYRDDPHSHHSHPHHYQGPSPSYLGLRPPPGRISPDSSASPSLQEPGRSVRYSPYMPPAPYPGRRSPGNSSTPDINIPSMSIRDYGGGGPSNLMSSSSTLGGGGGGSVHSRHHGNNITLPPIQSPVDRHKNLNAFALPPISAMEDLRGIHTHDSAAVLRRLRSEDNSAEVHAHPHAPAHRLVVDAPIPPPRAGKRSFSMQSYR